jgi:hypothetical protein
MAISGSRIDMKDTTRPAVIPGRAEGANPESRKKLGVLLWIPGSRATLAPRNDVVGPLGF